MGHLNELDIFDRFFRAIFALSWELQILNEILFAIGIARRNEKMKWKGKPYTNKNKWHSKSMKIITKIAFRKTIKRISRC